VSTPTAPSSPTPKPVSKIWRPDLTRLPRLTIGRRLFRVLFRTLCRAAVFACTKTTIFGRENYPHQGPALVVINHLGDPDAVLVVAALPHFPEAFAKIELRDIPWLRWLGDRLGVIWVHRGQPDRRAISAALEAFRLGRIVLIAPEGRESLSGALEAGTEGAAFLALEAGVPVMPVTLTGSESRRIENNLKKLKRSPVKVTIGKPFVLPMQKKDPGALQEGTRLIMETLAHQLPPEFSGVYAYVKG
jgi:1-acyl-sn-glycerol-3-phosphate acyltransferase